MVDFESLTPDEAVIWAAGYTAALEDHRPHWERIAVDSAAQARQLVQAEADAARYYHAAFCGCEKATVAAVVRGIDTRQNRDAWRAKYGMDAA
ncbi:hypothetical protein [Leifsonia aquatica]|uniref:hypothetical protein n=1 Tax=Leifsonia aquatica TaxID=144185 RepID=UPI0013B3B091|nr:hypothetical protein [Leifsonia aquatica]